jgi:hypothetical protein
MSTVGDVLAYPTKNGHCFNPYHSPKGAVGRYWSTWAPNGWGAILIVDRGRAFDFLSWYRPLIVAQAITEKPGLAALSQDALWRIDTPGTCSATHFKRMQLELIGTVPIDREKLHNALPKKWLTVPGTSAAISDISIANRMHLPRTQFYRLDASGASFQGYPTIRGLGQVLAA